MLNGRPAVTKAIAICLLLVGCAGQESATPMPAHAEAMLATFEAPPSGSFDCGFPLGSTVYGRPRGLDLDPAGSFEFFQHDGRGIVEKGQWTYASQVHQLGFAGDTVLDYGYYDLGAAQLILYLKQNAQGQSSTLHCARVE